MDLHIPLRLGLVATQVLLAGCVDSDRRPQPVSRTELIDAAEVVPVVLAAGTLKPVGEVEVGSEVSGRIAALLVDFNAVVRENDVMARIDPQAFHAQVQQAEAALLDARATAMMREAALSRASRSLRRISNLQSKEVASEDALDRAQTEVQMARAEVQQARAVVGKREAALEEAEVALSRTVIRSPINGVVISREVARGQTVAASLEAPRLFTIARTLSEMEIHARVDEADIGQIRTGQRATFTVAAHGDRDFDAHVVQVRVAPEIVENVVTYTVVLLAENQDESLLPGMTAITEIDVQSAAEEVQKLASTAAPVESRSREGLAEALRDAVERNPAEQVIAPGPEPPK
jgi:HlyD family secretion protein